MKRMIPLLMAVLLALSGCTSVIGVSASPIPLMLSDSISSVAEGKTRIRRAGGDGSDTDSRDAASDSQETVSSSAAQYEIAADHSNIINADDFSYYSEEFWEKLMENQFVVYGKAGYEFFDQYEYNRYTVTPNFITTDSMMHTYHLYFSYLMKQTEKEYLVNALTELSEQMLAQTENQLEALYGTDWENPAGVNTIFFAVGLSILDPDSETLAYLTNEMAEEVANELAMIEAAEAIEYSPLFADYEDYTQYKPRGYYEGDTDLERYFKAMMWYGRRNFPQNNEAADACALLMCLALSEGPEDIWKSIYDITSFFAGRSDDSGFEEYYPLILEAYGRTPAVDELPDEEDAFNEFLRLTGELESPAINSVPMADDSGETVKTDEAKGFRFMGQRFSLDASIFQKLCYSVVKENEDGDKRLLPDALDIPAALGSDEALAILDDSGKTNYPNYAEQMETVREMIQTAPESTWKASLYSEWLYTLQPLLTVKGEGYPVFMQNNAWTRKSLEGYLGSWSELKHDTVLYSKQFMAEMGGGFEGEVDDRGYVEPEPEVFSRLSALTARTAEGLSGYGMISDEALENLGRLQELADALSIIAQKELDGELPTDDEFELIKTFGGQLEHFWEDAVKDEAVDTYLDSNFFPAAIITDVATDPNGRVLEVGTGIPSAIYVVVPVEGILRIAVGSVYTYYEFEQPIDERLTDSEWRRMLGVEIVSEEDMYSEKQDVEQPAWATGYRAHSNW